MFSWICPQCGRDVPPSKSDCPYCAERAQEAALVAAQAPPRPPAEQPAAPQQFQPAPQAWQPGPPPQQPAPLPPYTQQLPQQYPPQPYIQQPQTAWQPPAPRAQPATWLMSVIFAVVFILIGGGAYYGIQHFGVSAAQKAGVENPANPSRQKVANPLQKVVEVVGVRLLSENKKPVARFVVVNHSSTEISDLAASVTLWASDSRSEEDAVGSFKFSLPELPANGSKELSSPLKTRLKMYELPDWQNATAEIQITSPSAP